MDDLLSLAVALAAAGAASGFLAGLFGVGGGAITVPVVDQFLAWLGYDADIRLHVALGTSLAVIVPTAWRSFASHRARGAVDLELLRSWLVAVPAGTLAASAVAGLVSGAALRLIFVTIAFLVAMKLVFRLDRVRLGDEIPHGPIRQGAGALIGFTAGLMGVGGGVMSNTFMTLYGRPIHNAVATSAGTGVLIAVPGMLGYMAAGFGTPGLPPWSVGYVNLPAVAIVTPLSLLVAPLGVRLAHGATKRQLEVAFGLFLLLVCLHFLISLR